MKKLILTLVIFILNSYVIANAGTTSTYNYNNVYYNTQQNTKPEPYYNKKTETLKKKANSNKYKTLSADELKEVQKERVKKAKQSSPTDLRKNAKDCEFKPFSVKELREIEGKNYNKNFK